MNGSNWINKRESEITGRRVTTAEGYTGTIRGLFGNRSRCFLIRFDTDQPGEGLHVWDAAACNVGRKTRESV